MDTSNRGSKPPSIPGRFTVGRDAKGRWVVCDRLGMTGGLFTSREAAMHFARTEAGDARGAVCCLAEKAVLDAFASIRPAETWRQSFRRAA